MALLNLTGRDAPLNPPLEGPHGLRSLDAELSDARVAISEAKAVWSEARPPLQPYTTQALAALSLLGHALASRKPDAIDRAWLVVDRLWRPMHQRRPGVGFDAVVWRAVFRVRAACWAWMAGTIYPGAESKKPSSSEALMLGKVCKEI